MNSYLGSTVKDIMSAMELDYAIDTIGSAEEDASRTEQHAQMAEEIDEKIKNFYKILDEISEKMEQGKLSKEDIATYQEKLEKEKEYLPEELQEILVSSVKNLVVPFMKGNSDPLNFIRNKLERTKKVIRNGPEKMPEYIQ